MAGVESNPGPLHHENRSKVCAMCLLKADKNNGKNNGKNIIVNERQEKLIREKVNAVYDSKNICLPIGMCNSCRSKIKRDCTDMKVPDYGKIFKNGSLKWTRDRETKANNVFTVDFTSFYQLLINTLHKL